MQDRFAQAVECFQQGQWARAELLARQVLDESPGFAPGIQLLGMVLAQQGNVCAARDVLRQAVQLKPLSAQAWLNFGNACLACEDMRNAEEAFAHARELGAGDEVAYLLGHGLTHLGNHDYAGAHTLLKRALAYEPEAADVRLAYAQCLAELERFDEIGPCVSGLDAADLDLPQQRALAWLLAQAGDDEAALRMYQRLLAATPVLDESRVQLALLLERLNRVDDAAQVLAAITASDMSAMHALCVARVLRRQGRSAAAIMTLSHALSTPMPAAMRAQLQFELAKCQDQQGAVDAVMQALEQAHAAAADAFVERAPKQAAAPVLGWLQQRMHAPMPAHWQAPMTDGLPADPVFLVGFPRSGTTLLERMLDGHSQLDVLDERPALEVMIESLRSSEHWHDDSLDASLDGLAPAALQQARRQYWQEVARHLQPQGRLVDKYPLTMTRLPYVARLFPQADWLLLLRHPCDCVLSCYMQAFGINGGALAFASLESTARIYAAVMEWWEQQREFVPARVHVLRYEDLVRDVPMQLQALMEFLSLAVAPQQLASHHASAARSRRINTPSYSQVVQPVNASAVGRWKRYRAHFSETALATLAPWIERYGYGWD